MYLLLVAQSFQHGVQRPEYTRGTQKEVYRAVFVVTQSRSCVLRSAHSGHLSTIAD